MRKRNYYRYRDTCIKIDKYTKTTKVAGSLTLDENEWNKLDRLQRDIDDAIEDVETFIHEVGKSTCCKEDTYNQKKGIIVASRKCELKTMKKALRQVTNLRRALEKELELVKDMEDKLDLKFLTLSLQLIKINRE